VNAVDLGTAYQPQYQDPTLGANETPGASAVTTNALRPYQGAGIISERMTRFHETYHSIQASFNRRFRNGVQFGLNYTLGLSDTGNTGLDLRLQHAADGSYSVRPDQAEYEALNRNAGLRRHLIKGSAVWDLPNLNSDGGGSRVLAAIVNDWQLSGVLSAGSGAPYNLGYSYQNGGGSVNLTGSPDYDAGIIYLADPGSGCSSDLYRQFNAAAVTGPTYNSVGLESGRNLLRGCPDHRVDLAIARNFNLGGGRQFQVRLDMFNLDMFNAFNTVILSARSSTIQYVSPTNLTVRNSETLPDGSIDPDRTQPKNAGFGAATNASDLRNLQLTARFSF
jgi:hypothetical protein